MRLISLAIGVFLAAAPVGAQTAETLADIRQVTCPVLFVEIQRLKRELSTTGASTLALPSGAWIGSTRSSPNCSA